MCILRRPKSGLGSLAYIGGSSTRTKTAEEKTKPSIRRGRVETLLQENLDKRENRQKGRGAIQLLPANSAVPWRWRR